MLSSEEPGADYRKHELPDLLAVNFPVGRSEAGSAGDPLGRQVLTVDARDDRQRAPRGQPGHQRLRRLRR